MNLLFITSSRIGDAILSTGLLNHWIEKHPGIQVTVAASPLTLPLFEGVPHLSRLIPLEKQSYKRHWLDLWRQCRSTSWDSIIDIRGSLVSYFLRSQEKYVWKSSPLPYHRVEQLGRLLNLTPPPAPHLWLKGAHLQRAEALIPKDVPVLALAPAANWIGKQWPPAAFAVLISSFLENHAAKIAVFAAAHERSSILPVLEAIPEDKRIDLVGSLSLLEIAACLKQCRAFVGNDSGLMHMAAAVGTPTIGLFGPSDDRLYAPYCPPGVPLHQVIRTPESLDTLKKLPDFSFQAPRTFMENLKPASVLQALERVWNASPFPQEKEP